MAEYAAKVSFRLPSSETNLEFRALSFEFRLWFALAFFLTLSKCSYNYGVAPESKNGGMWPRPYYAYIRIRMNVAIRFLLLFPFRNPLFSFRPPDVTAKKYMFAMPILESRELDLCVRMK